MRRVVRAQGRRRLYGQRRRGGRTAVEEVLQQLLGAADRLLADGDAPLEHGGRNLQGVRAEPGGTGIAAAVLLVLVRYH